ncbi:polyprenol reductase 2-like isoform X1 [Senna tora]|uniref:Polyprenol reductase 2-like isoform X1 n=1 Tax=Senna tora TaxID=362788 RepID=A0A834SF07_9FABA|nr:polyprenol reductase 2-like isoform X1 [Senna tora]
MEVDLVLLLRFAWIAASLPVIIASIPTNNLNWFRGVLLGFAKRGKIMQSSSQKFTVSQRFFLHFYIVASVWTTLLLVATWIYAYRMVSLIADPNAYSTITSYLTGASSIKADSTIIPQSPSARMHIIGYFTGFFFYIAAPLSLCCDCALEVYDFAANSVITFILKGKGQMQESELEPWQFLNPLFKLGWQPWIGATIFLWGWIHQYRCHTILGSLREHSKQVDEYVIPHGDWFQLVSSPHYLAEIVIYGGFVVASGGANITIWLLFVFVVVNLAFAAVETHRWYLHKFEDYPTTRFAIIPYIL